MSESPVTVPVCYRHPSKETYVRCTRCDRPICPDCMNAASVGHQCPECVAEGRKTQRSAKTAFGGSLAGRAGVVTRTLIGINVAVMIISVITGGIGAVAGGGWGGLLGQSTPLTDWGAVLPYAPYFAGGPEHGIAAGEWWRLVTAMFLHFGVLHLLMNMYALWILGRELEGVLGRLRFTALYLLAGLGGNVAAYFLMAATFVILRRLKLSVAPILPVIVINVIFTFVIANISVGGHIGGLITGAVVAAILAYAPQQRRNLIQGVGCAAVLVLLLVLAIMRTASLLM